MDPCKSFSPCTWWINHYSLGIYGVNSYITSSQVRFFLTQQVIHKRKIEMQNESLDIHFCISHMDWRKKYFIYLLNRKRFCFMLQKLKDPNSLCGSDTGICVAQSQRTFENQDLITKIINWKNSISYWEESKQSEGLTLMSSSSPNLSSYVILKDYTRYQTTKYEGKGTSKIQVFKIFSEFEKTWKYRLSYSKDPVFHLFHELGKTWK